MVGDRVAQPGSWQQHAFERLASAGYRRGGARTAVVELLDTKACALSAVEIEHSLGSGERPAGRASVYRVLEELESLGLVTRLDVGDGTARYEALRPEGANHHHHLVCSTCRRLVPFHDDELERAIRRLSRRADFAVDDHDVILRGTCSDCEDDGLG
jgi:Fur family ferric uptake transcriptional regulator